MRDLVIVGAGGHGRELLDIVEAMNADRSRWNVLGFLAADDPHPERVAARGLEILGDTPTMERLACDYVVGIGHPPTRRRVDEKLQRAGGTPVSLRHPSAVVGGATTMGDGYVLAANAVVTTNVVLGRSVHVNVGSTVAHDCRLGDYTILAPGVHLAGAITTGEGVDIGVGASVRPGTTLGAGAVVGAGAAVVADVEPGAVVAGVPARRLR